MSNSNGDRKDGSAAAPRILHFLTPLPNVSPFDINMAIDSGFAVASYTGIGLGDVTALTQDAMFSRAPQDAPKTCLFIGGRDAALALEMADAARKATFPPFQISIFADPNGAFTTAAAMIACIERQLRRDGAGALAGRRVAVLGAKGIVGGIAGLIAAEAGANVTLVAHDRSGVVAAKAADFEKRFNTKMASADGSTPDERKAALRDTEIVLAAGRAGVQVVSHDELAAAAGSLKLVVDVNAVPPLGVEGLAVDADGTPLGIGDAKGIGALAVGNIKFKTQHRLLRRIHAAEKAQFVAYREAYEAAKELAAS
jgi:methylene-tetrahydromethanopterin dehydrogenase